MKTLSRNQAQNCMHMIEEYKGVRYSKLWSLEYVSSNCVKKCPKFCFYL